MATTKWPEILLVEDSATQAIQFAERLEQAGYSVTCAGSGEEALDMLAANTPALLIADYHLPGIRGDELCRRVRLNAETRSIPVLMITGSDDEDIEKLGLRSGVDDYIAKQETFEVVTLRIRALLRRSQVSITGVVGDNRARRPKLLVVDDSATWLAFIAGSLAENGYEVVTAERADTAWDIYGQDDFDGAIIDLHLPDISGSWLCHKISRSQNNPASQCIIMVLTGDEDPDNLPQVLDAGADDVVHKSRNIEVIRARLEALLRRKFLHEENQRLLANFRDRERRLLRAEAKREAAEAQAALAAELALKNTELERAYDDLKQAQSSLVQKAKLASLGELVAGVAHEINNPLSFVMSHVATIEDALQVLTEECDGTLSAKGSQKLSKANKRFGNIRDGLIRIRDLVLNLRTFSRLDNSDIQKINVHEALEATLALLHHRTRDGVEIERHFDALPAVECQAGPMNQVWMNLMANAIDAMQESGKLVLSTRDVGDDLEVEIGDNGAGMSEEVQARIFDPFYTTKSQNEGTGLGLSISYGIVKAHCGEITVRSKPGQGTRLAVRLPRKFSPGDDAGR